MSAHLAVPVVPDGASVQLLALLSVPVAGDAPNVTVPAGVPVALAAVSITVAVQLAGRPVVTDDGEHATLVDVGSAAVTAVIAALAWSTLSPP